MAGKEIDEMASYRAKAARSRNALRSGRRKSDAPALFWSLGWILEALFLAIMGMWLLSACVGRYL